MTPGWWTGSTSASSDARSTWRMWPPSRRQSRPTGSCSSTGRRRAGATSGPRIWRRPSPRPSSRAAVARGLAGQTGNPVLLLGFHIAGQGKSPDSARVDGRVRLTAVRDDGDRVELGQATVRLAGGRLDLRPELLAGGGTISAVGRV